MRSGPTIYDLARETNLSPSTVSRALTRRGQLSDRTVRLVQAAAERMNYRPNAIARSLSAQRTLMIAVVLPDIANPFFPTLVREIEVRARHQGYTVMLCNTGGEADTERAWLETLATRLVDGIFLIGLSSDAALLESYVGQGLNFVSLDRSIPSNKIPCVQADHRGGSSALVRHLLALGHERIAYISGPRTLPVAQDRLIGYQDALASGGITPDKTLTREGNFTERSGYSAALSLLSSDRNITAIAAANDLMALGALAAARELGVAVPGSLSIAGFDDLDLGKYSVPTLTTARQPLGHLAQAGLDQLFSPRASQIGPLAPKVFPVEVVPRQSTAPVQGGSRKHRLPNSMRVAKSAPPAGSLLHKPQ